MTRVFVVFVIIAIFSSATFSAKSQEVTEKVTFIHDSEDIRPRLFNKKYLKNEDQLWLLSEGRGIWGLVFKEFSVEPSKNCRHDYLEVTEISLNKTDILKPPSRYCGETVPLPYISTYSRLEVRFITDSLWELNGFWIQALHASNEELLRDKMERLSQRRYKTLALKTSDEGSSLEESPGVLSEKGPVYYILIGSSAAALLVFGGLLIYYVIAVRRQRKAPASVPDLVYVNDRIKSDSRNSSRSDVPLLDFASRPASLPVRPYGRKYSRDRSDNKQPSADNTFQKTIVLEGQCRNNNLYITPLRKK